MYTASGSGVVVVEDDRVGRGHLGVVVPILGRLCQNKSTHYDLVKNKSAISQILRAEIYNIFGSSFLFSVTTYLVYIAIRRQFHLKIDRTILQNHIDLHSFSSLWQLHYFNSK